MKKLELQTYPAIQVQLQGMEYDPSGIQVNNLSSRHIRKKNQGHVFTEET